MGAHLRRLGCVAALVWLAFGVGGRAEAEVMLQTAAGLNPGDTFRFVFVTGGIRDATSANIADYDSFVKGQAGAATYNGIVVDWLAISSTVSVDAIDHVGQATAPVYLSDGTLVTTATIPVGLWSGAHVHEINLDLAANPVHTLVWTGTNPVGTGFGGPLGSGTPQVGSTTDTDGSWVSSGRSNSGDLRALYGISSVLTVPQTAGALPPMIAKSFADLQLELFGPGDTTELSFKITNPNSSALTGVAFIDTLPSGLIVANPKGVTGSWVEGP